MTLSRIFALFAAVLLAACDQTATEDTKLEASDGWAREMPLVGSNGGAFVTLSNPGKNAVEIASLSTPIAETAEVHETLNDNGVARMRKLESLSVNGGESVALEPGGKHIMLIGLKEPLKAGQTFPVTFTLSNGTSVTVDVTAVTMKEAMERSVGEADHGDHHHH